MQESIATCLVLPAALAVIMLGLKLSLTPTDFKRVVVYPNAVVVGLVCQVFVLPFVCFSIAIGFALSAPLAVELMLLSASPRGPTANLFIHLAKGDVAPDSMLTAVNSVLSVATLPVTSTRRWFRFMALELCDKERQNIGVDVREVGLASLVFNLSSMTVGYAVPRPLRIDERQATAVVGMDIRLRSTV